GDDLRQHANVADPPAADQHPQAQEKNRHLSLPLAGYRPAFHAARGMTRPLPLPLGAALPRGPGASTAFALTFPRRVSTWSMIARTTRAEFWMPVRSFCVSGSSPCSRAPPQPTTVGTDRHTSLTPYRPCCNVLTGRTR